MSGELWLILPRNGVKVLFKGSYRHTIDAKGRIIIPSKLKKSFSEAAEDTLVMLPGKNRCIELYPKDVWQKIEENLAKLNPNDPENLKIIRFYSNNAHEDVMDTQGRILIPSHLKQKAGIDSDVIIVGTVRYIEVWNPEVRSTMVSDDRDEIDAIAATHLPWIS